ncbi:hypothetical protein BC834DRAFT_965432 [Gloeopeniophorella convolvens]|nr:hypothetical protein BC834DRAFT_965432 [Gloeopeniophorella convolvens]
MSGMALAVAARRPALLLFATLETLVIGTAWYRYRPSALVGKPKSHIPAAKFFG